MRANAPSKILLIVLDGFGIGKDYPFNAIQNSKMPFYKALSKQFAQSRLIACGEEVGLPAGVMGNSEVGHTNMGAGRIVYQELTRINREIRSKDFFRNPVLNDAIRKVKSAGGRLHLMGLLSDGGVHSMTSHLQALVELAEKSVPVTIHIFTDGRDTPPGSALRYIDGLGAFLKKHPGANVGSLSGRFYAMDRDKRWERTRLAFEAICGRGPFAPLESENGAEAALKAFEKSLAQGVADEFVVPVRFESAHRAAVADGDGVIFFNFRADRARQLTRAFTQGDFKEFSIGVPPKLSVYACMTEYDKTFGLPVAYAPQNLSRILPDLLAERGLAQFRIAETEKYAHVTFFFNGGRENPYSGEERCLIPSPKEVPTYDLKPEMSLPEVSSKLAERLSRGTADFVLTNFANPDMVGHTGFYEAALKALEAVDHGLETTVKAGLSQGYEILITADHGNIEEMRDDHDHPHTQHTLNPVPFHLVSKHRRFELRDGILADLAPTVLQLMNVPQPQEMTGKSLIRAIL